MYPWTLTHLKIQMPVLALMALTAWLLRRALKNKRERIRMIPLQIVATTIALLEIIKQYKSITEGYDLFHLPLHVCSLIILLLLGFAFYNGRYRAPLRGVTVTLCAGLCALMLLCPAIIYSEESLLQRLQSFYDFHTTAYHLLTAFALFLVFALDLHEPRPRRDLKLSLAVMLIYCAVAATAANLLKVNFNNFYRCNFELGDQLRLLLHERLDPCLGQALYAVLFSLITLLGLPLAYLLYYLLYRIKRRK